MTKRKLSRKQVAQLGGYAASRKLGAEGRAARSAKGGAANAAKGKEYFVRLAHQRWGRLQTPKQMAAPEGGQELVS